MRIDQQQLNALLPAALAWAGEACANALESGAALEPAMIDLARAAGVAHPERIRIVSTMQVPYPDDSRLMEVGLALGMIGPSVHGMTLGYAVFIKQGEASARLLSHEFRHVHQYERAGSLEAFLTEYLGQIVSSGYRDATMEIDARAHEHDGVPASDTSNGVGTPCSISREDAARIAAAAIRKTKYAVAEQPVREVVHVAELGDAQPPRPVGLHPSRLAGLWICYMKREVFAARSSLVVLVCRTTGVVEYLGSANDEG